MDARVVLFLAALSANAVALPQFGQAGAIAPAPQPNQLGIFQPGAIPSLLSALNPINIISSATPSINSVVSSAVASTISAPLSRAPSSGPASSAPPASERRDPQPQFSFPGLNGLTPTPTLVLALPTVTLPTQTSGLGQLNSVIAGVGNGVSSLLNTLPSATTVPHELIQPVSNALVQNPMAAMQLAFASLCNTALGGMTTGPLSQLTNSLTGLFSPFVNYRFVSYKKRQEDEVTTVDVSPEDAPEDVTPEEVAPEEVAPEEQTPEENTTEDITEEDVPDDDYPDDDYPDDDNPDNDIPDEDIPEEENPETTEDVAPEEETPLEGFPPAWKLAERQLGPTAVNAIPSAAVVPSGVTDSIAIPGSFAPLADATPLAVVPASLAALAPNGAVASAAVPPVLVSALADPTINPLAVANSVDPLAPVPTQLIPSSAAAAVAAAASALAPPIKRAIAEIAERHGLQERDVAALQAGIDTSPDPTAFIAQWVAAQAKPILKELGNQIQGAPSLFASVAAAQASIAAVPVSIVGEQLSAAKPLVDAIPSIVQSQLGAVPSAAAPVFSAASSILEDLQSASVGTGNALNALLPNPTVVANIVADSLPDITVSVAVGLTQTTPEPAVAATVGANIPNVASVGQDFGITPAAPVPAVITPLPTIYPVVGSPSKSQQQADSLQQNPPLQQDTVPVQPYTPQKFPSQPASSLPEQSIPFAQPYQIAAPIQGTNSAAGLVNKVNTAVAAVAVPVQTLPAIELPDSAYGELPDTANNIITDPLTQPFSPDNMSRLLKNMLYLQLAPILLLIQSFSAASNPAFTLSSLSSSLLQNLGSSLSPSSNSPFSPNNRILLASSPSSPTSPTPTSPAIDPLVSAWLAGAKLLQSNPQSAGNPQDLLSSLLSGLGSSPLSRSWSSDDLSSVLSSFIDSPLNQALTSKFSRLTSWTINTQVAAMRLGSKAWLELIEILLS